jgi:toxin-antitoxin system PIN domain toxin
VIALDTNILVYAHRDDSEWHEPASACVRTLAEAGPAWAIPWHCVHEFLATVTSSRIFHEPTPVGVALETVKEWLASPTLVLLAEGPDHWRVLHEQLVDGNVLGPRVHDARIAAVCLAAGVQELWTLDRDFSRFPALRTRNPLQAASP